MSAKREGRHVTYMEATHISGGTSIPGAVHSRLSETAEPQIARSLGFARDGNWKKVRRPKQRLPNGKGDDLLSHTLSRAVQPTQRGLT
jgi:hypothetical protein